jgi:hypothetical protein
MMAFPAFEDVPASARDEYARKFTELAAACLQRHAPVVPTVAQGILELKRDLKGKKLDRYVAFGSLRGTEIYFANGAGGAKPLSFLFFAVLLLMGHLSRRNLLRELAL